ncbi:MAG: hypothetical protein ACJAWW_001979 [Sulfurimonas sp.]|jgi:hypothetical protein
MKNTIITSSVIACALLSTSAFAKDDNAVDSFLSNIKQSGQIRVAYVNYNYDGDEEYSSAIGGNLRLETSVFDNMIDIAISPYFGTNIGSLSGSADDGDYHTSLTGNDESYMTVGEAYIGFKQDSVSVKLGRQIIDTPLLGDDDMRLTPQTFQGVMANFEKDTFGIHAGYFNAWQGYDAGLNLNDSVYNYEFKELSTDSDGALVLGAKYTTSIKDLELNTQAWYYDIDKLAGVAYADITLAGAIGENIGYDLGFQISEQSEKDESGYEASLFGLMAGIGYGDLYLYTAYAKSSLETGKSLFNGLGGTFFYTAGNEWSMGYLDAGEDETSAQVGLDYTIIEGLNLSAYYTDFQTDSSHVIATDIFLTVAASKRWDTELVYTMIDEEKGTTVGSDYTNILFRANYNF